MTMYRIAIPSAARTAEAMGPATNIGGFAGAHVVIDVTARAGASAITAHVEAHDAASGKWYTILSSAAISSVSTVVLKIHPQFTAAANTVAKDGLPQNTRVRVAHGNADSITYSVGVNFI